MKSPSFGYWDSSTDRVDAGRIEAIDPANVEDSVLFSVDAERAVARFAALKIKPASGRETRPYIPPRPAPVPYSPPAIAPAPSRRARNPWRIFRGPPDAIVRELGIGVTFGRTDSGAIDYDEVEAFFIADRYPIRLDADLTRRIVAQVRKQRGAA